MKHPRKFETERLFLRATQTDDAAFVRELMNSPKWLEYIGDRNIRSDSDAANYIEEKMLTQLKRLGYGNFTLIRKEKGEKIGLCGLYDRPGLEGVDIGFAMLTQFEGKGYAFEAAHKILELAFTEFHLKEVKAITSLKNRPSQKLLEKLGMKKMGVLTLPDEEEELLWYLKKKTNSQP